MPLSEGIDGAAPAIGAKVAARKAVVKADSPPRALGKSIFTAADDFAALEGNVRDDAVRCHFEPDEMPHVVRLHFTREQAYCGSRAISKSFGPFWRHAQR